MKKHMKVNGKITSQMAKENWGWEMAVFTLANSITEKSMGMESIHLQINLFIKEIGKMIIIMGKVNSSGGTVADIKVNGNRAWCMESANWPMRMGVFIMDNLRTIKNMEKASLHTQMVLYTMVNGLIVNLKIHELIVKYIKRYNQI